MCEAQVASLRSRLERRVNRIPNSKRSMSLVELLDPPSNVPAKVMRSSPAKKETAPAPVLAPVPVRAPVQPAVRKTKAAPPKAAPRAVSKATRGKKRPSDDGDKENEELNVPKKRAKATTKPAASAQPAASAPAPASRSTRAASKKGGPIVPSQVLSPKPNNSRPATRTRRAR